MRSRHTVSRSDRRARSSRATGLGSLLAGLLPGLVSLAVVFAVAPLAGAEDGGSAKESAAAEEGTAAASSVQSALDRQLDELPSGEEGVAQILGELTRRLELSEAQQEQVEPILQDAVASMEKIRDRYRAGEISAMALGMQLQMAGQRAAGKVEPLLDAGQAEEYAQMRQEQRREMMQAIQRAGVGLGATGQAGAQ